MKSDTVVVIVLALLLGLSAYVAADQWYIGIGVGLVAMTAGLFFVLPCLRRYVLLNRKRHECYLFIHGYLVTLSVCMSLEKAFETASEPMGEDYHRLDETLATMEAREKVTYLSTYFDMPLYAMFLSVLELYLDRGGDVLKLSNELTAEASRLEETGMTYSKQAARKGASFFFLWVMAVVVMMFLRFGFSTFFSQLKTSWTYLGSLLCFYAFLVVSVCVYTVFHTGCRPSIKRGENHAKTAQNNE